jgi:TIR domain-containing protein
VRVFISYQSKDVKFVEMISTTISRIGLEPIVVENTSLPGENITTKVLTALNEFDLFLPIITRNSVNSQWLNQEIGYAIAKKTDITHITNLSFDFILPVIEKGISKNIKGFLVNIEGIPYERYNPDITIANIVKVLFDYYIQENHNIRFSEICKKCKEDMDVSFSNYQGILEAITKELHLYISCPSCDEIYQYSPFTLQIKKQLEGTSENIERIFG